MIRTKLLTKIDNCLRDYVDVNNTRYKRNINSILMDKKKLTNFYNDMIEEKQEKLISSINNGSSSKKKSFSFSNKQNRAFTNWKSAKKIKINEVALITNLVQAKSSLNRNKETEQHTQIGTQNLRTHENNFTNSNSLNNNRLKIRRDEKKRHNFSKYDESQWVNLPKYINQVHERLNSQLHLQRYSQDKRKQNKNRLRNEIENDKQQIQKFRKMQQQKYINKYMMKRKKLVKEDENIASTSNNLIPNQNLQVQNKKMKVLFDRILQDLESQKYNYGNKQIQAMRTQKNHRDNVQRAINAYYYKKNRYLPYS